MIVLDARKNFLQSNHAKGWGNVVAESQFQAAATAALVAMKEQMPKAANESDAVAQYWMLHGAAYYLRVLMNLEEPTIQPPRPPARANLQEI